MTLEILRADTLSAHHGFFTRKGGASSGIFEGLNCGQGSSDQASAVATNRSRVAQAMEVPTEALVSLHQVHSADVITVTSPLTESPKADAMVTATPGLALGILTADCAPVLFADAQAGVIGAAHGGWKGALGGVTDATVAAMRTFGATQITAAIGPTIAQASYEVDPAFMDRFLDDDPDNDRHFADGRDPDHVQFDLPGYLLLRLRAAGAEAAWIGYDTYANPARFYSYRRSIHAGEADYGRLISCIRL